MRRNKKRRRFLLPEGLRRPLSWGGFEGSEGGGGGFTGSVGKRGAHPWRDGRALHISEAHRRWNASCAASDGRGLEGGVLGRGVDACCLLLSLSLLTVVVGAVGESVKVEGPRAVMSKEIALLLPNALLLLILLLSPIQPPFLVALAV